MKITTILEIIGVILIFLAVLILIFYFRNQGNICMGNPLEYYQNLSNSVCYCTKIDMNSIHNIKW